MGNTSREVPCNDSPDTGFLNYVHGSLPTSPLKSPPLSSSSSSAFAYERKKPVSVQFESSSFRRHSVVTVSSPGQATVPGHREKTNNREMTCYELDDSSTSASGDDSSTCTNSPQIHRKIERSRSEPKAPQLQPHMMMSPPNDSLTSIGTSTNQHSNRYKTELCRAYLEAGHCKYGEKCQFAHGHREVRIVSRHPKYKTEYCRSFHATGLCAYGPRCHFIHNPDELNQQQQQQQLPRRTSASSLSDKNNVVPEKLSQSEMLADSSKLSQQGSSVSSTTAGSVGGRPRAISLSAFPPNHPHPAAIPIAQTFIADQLLELGSCGNSLTTVSSTGSSGSYSGSYSSSPLSQSPGIAGFVGGFSTWRNQDLFSNSVSGPDGLGSNDHTGSYPDETGELLGPWAYALANLLSDLE